MSSRLCKVYKSPRKKLTFLYVDAAADLTPVPAQLLESFGQPQWVMNLQLQSERKLALVTGAAVLNQIEACGYYLQLPPPPEHAVTTWLRGDEVRKSGA